MAISWPFTTGRASKLLGDPSVEPVPDILESQVDAGRPKRRALRSKFDDMVTGYVVMTNEEHKTFRTWYAQTARGGALPFEWISPVDDEPATFQFTGSRAPRAEVLVGNSDPDKIVWAMSLTLRMLAA